MLLAPCHAGDLGYQVRYLLDATRAVDRASVDVDGGSIPIATPFEVTGMNLYEEFATVNAPQ